MTKRTTQAPNHSLSQNHGQKHPPAKPAKATQPGPGAAGKK